MKQLSGVVTAVATVMATKRAKVEQAAYRRISTGTSAISGLTSIPSANVTTKKHWNDSRWSSVHVKVNMKKKIRKMDIKWMTTGSGPKVTPRVAPATVMANPVVTVLYTSHTWDKVSALMVWSLVSDELRVSATKKVEKKP